MDEQTADYTRAGLQGRLEIPTDRMAVAVVDPVEVYTNRECPLYAGVEDAVERMRELVAATRRAGVPLVVTRVEHHHTGYDASVYGRKIPALKWYAADSPYSGYIDGLAPGPGDIEIVKQYPSAFVHTSLSSTLTAMGVSTLVIAGLSTSGCIRATALDALQYGFVPIVVSDAVGDRLPGPHEANLFDIRAKIGELLTTAEVIGLMAEHTPGPAR